MELTVDIFKQNLTPPDKARIDSILILPTEKRIVITTTEGYDDKGHFVAVKKGKSFIYKDDGSALEYSNLLSKTKFDELSLKSEIESKYDFDIKETPGGLTP